MSDRAREYVKKLDFPWNLKSFMFLVADYHRIGAGCAWPGLDAIAAVMRIARRNVKRIIRELEMRGAPIQWVPGIGRGNREKLVFKDLQKDYASDPFLELKRGHKGGHKRGQFQGPNKERTREPENHSPHAISDAAQRNFDLRDLRLMGEAFRQLVKRDAQGSNLLARMTDAEVLSYQCEYAGIDIERALHLKANQVQLSGDKKQPHGEVAG